MVAGVTDFGIFVELADMPVEGMIRIDDLGDDWYDFDPHTMSLVGQRSGVMWRMGQSLEVALAEVNLGRLEIRLMPLELPKAAQGGAGRGRGKPTRRPARKGGAKPGSTSRPGGLRCPVLRRLCGRPAGWLAPAAPCATLCGLGQLQHEAYFKAAKVDLGQRHLEALAHAPHDAGALAPRLMVCGSKSYQSSPRSSMRIMPSTGMSASSTNMPKSVTPHHPFEVLAHAGQQGKAAHAAIHLAFAGHGRTFAPVDLVADAQQLLPGGQCAHADAQSGLECPMGQQVGVAADGRGKVAVRLRSQAKVPLVDGLVAGLRHGPQAQAVDQEFLIRALYAGKYALHGGGIGLAGRSSIPVPASVSKRLSSRSGSAGDARGTKRACPRRAGTRHGLVGRDHEFFNKPVGVVPQPVPHPDNAPCFVQAAIRLGQVKVKAAALAACFAQRRIQGKGLLQHGDNLIAARVFAQGGKGAGSWSSMQALT